LWDDLENETALIADLRPTKAPSNISIVQVSDFYTRFTVTGPDAPEVMAVASPLDIHSSVFSDNAFTFTEIFTLKGLLWRCPGGFEFAIEQSYGDMVEDYLNRTLA
jgi:sarcosine oxidase subunit gamma